MWFCTNKSSVFLWLPQVEKSLQRIQNGQRNSMYTSQQSVENKVGGVPGWQALLTAVGFRLDSAGTGLPAAVFFPTTDPGDRLQQCSSTLQSLLGTTRYRTHLLLNKSMRQKDCQSTERSWTDACCMQKWQNIVFAVCNNQTSESRKSQMCKFSLIAHWKLLTQGMKTSQNKNETKPKINNINLIIFVLFRIFLKPFYMVVFRLRNYWPSKNYLYISCYAVFLPNIGFNLYINLFSFN